MHEWKYGSRHHRNISTANQFQQPQSMRDLLVAPLVPANDGDAQHFHLGRLNQGQERLHIAAAGSRTVLIDDHFPRMLRECRAPGNQQE
jgi:hypothetical protein